MNVKKRKRLINEKKKKEKGQIVQSFRRALLMK